jgi:hypothetical protein
MNTKDFWIQNSYPHIHAGYEDPGTALINKKKLQEIDNKWIM